MLYALLDASSVIRIEHLSAALALWEYCEASAEFVFGDRLGDPVADELLDALRNNPDGLTRTDVRDLFKRHQSSERIDRILTDFEAKGIAVLEREQTGGRPKEVWKIATKAT